MNILGWLLWWVVFLLGLGSAFTSRVDISHGRTFVLRAGIQTFFWWLIASLFYFTNWNKLHILWVVPISCVVASHASSGSVTAKGFLRIVYQLVIFAATRFMMLFWIGVRISYDAAVPPSYIRKALMAGGTAYLTVGREKRMLWHEPMVHAPSTKLLWPLSLLQLHNVSLSVRDLDDKNLRRKTFTRREINKAIQEFLLDKGDGDQVIVSEDWRL